MDTFRSVQDHLMLIKKFHMRTYMSHLSNVYNMRYLLNLVLENLSCNFPWQSTTASTFNLYLCYVFKMLRNILNHC